MSIELSAQDIRYEFNTENVEIKNKFNDLPEYTYEVYDKIKLTLNIEKDLYNMYLIDDFSKEKLNNIKEYAGKILESRDKPKDICYVVSENPNKPFPLFLCNGKGKVLKETVENIQNKYFEIIYDFYSNSSYKEKEDIIEGINEKRNSLVKELINTAHDEGFEVRTISKGFTFIPLKDDEVMTEKEYDDLDSDKKEEILKKVDELKVKSQDLLKNLKEVEIKEIGKIRELMNEFLTIKMRALKEKYESEFYDNIQVLRFLQKMCIEIEKDVIEAYSMTYEDDEETINNIIMKYDVNVLVDNSKVNSPRVIFEEDPSSVNLFGSIDYKSESGTYVSDVSLIKGGSILKANGGCLIIRANNLLLNPTAYYNLKKTILSGKIDFASSKKYIELLSLKGLEPESINISEKIILIGDYETYNLLYNYDSDFKRIFKIRAQYKPIVEIEDNIKSSLLKNIQEICKKDNILQLDKSAVKEVAKFLSRRAEHREKLYFNIDELNKILILCNNRILNEERKNITGKDIIDTVYKEDIIEKEYLKLYEEGKILINIKGEKIGQINGLAVIDSGYFSFGKPIKITCSCYKGEGEIIDVQKQSELSGNIHSKAVNILKGVIGEMFAKYNTLPVNFHLSFEQVYGKIDGDSASVAELISMISALSAIPIKQNIAVTGSINQFGEVQSIGGVNEKIEGFFKVCKLVDGIKGKGVLIPYHNSNNIVLSNEIEEAVEKGEFHIYTMQNIEDAINVLMKDYKEVFISIKREIKKYLKKNN